MGDIPSVPRSSDVVDLGNKELGLLGFPQAPLLPIDLGQVAGGAELACSQVATVHRLLRETLIMVGQDVLQLAQVSLQDRKEKNFHTRFFRFFLLWLMPFLILHVAPSSGRG
jgi:hypothetical protein